MVKNYTSIEQGKKLMELGIDITTADMCWCNENDVITIPYIDSLIQYCPAWSLSALLKLIPNFNMFKRTIECRIETANHLIDKAWEPLDAAFEMVCWLKENKKI